MKTIPSILAIVSIALLTASCGEKTETTVEAPAVEATADTTETYPMTTCPVSGEELGSMGDPVIVEHEGTTVKLCCKSCIEDFNADPEKYTAMVKEAGKQ